jgi:hypothetical protein
VLSVLLSFSPRVYAFAPASEGLKGSTSSKLMETFAKRIFSRGDKKKERKEELQLWEDFFLSHVFQIAFEKNFISLMT